MEVGEDKSPRKTWNKVRNQKIYPTNAADAWKFTFDSSFNSLLVQWNERLKYLHYNGETFGFILYFKADFSQVKY